MQLGQPNVDKMLAELPEHNWQEWIQFAANEPFGGKSWDNRIGWILAVLVQAITGREANPEDYVPRWGQQKASRQSAHIMRAVVQAWGKQVNAHSRENQS